MISVVLSFYLCSSSLTCFFFGSSNFQLCPLCSTPLFPPSCWQHDLSKVHFNLLVYSSTCCTFTHLFNCNFTDGVIKSPSCITFSILFNFTSDGVLVIAKMINKCYFCMNESVPLFDMTLASFCNFHTIASFTGVPTDAVPYLFATLSMLL